MGHENIDNVIYALYVIKNRALFLCLYCWFWLYSNKMFTNIFRVASLALGQSHETPVPLKKYFDKISQYQTQTADQRMVCHWWQPSGVICNCNCFLIQNAQPGHCFHGNDISQILSRSPWQVQWNRWIWTKGVISMSLAVIKRASMLPFAVSNVSLMWWMNAEHFNILNIHPFGPRLNLKTVVPGMAIHIIKITRLWNRRIFIMVRRYP